MLMTMMNQWEIRHIAQHSTDEYDWYDDEQIYTGWFNHNTAWSDEPSEAFMEHYEERKKDYPGWKFRIVVEKRAFVRRIIGE